MEEISNIRQQVTAKNRNNRLKSLKRKGILKLFPWLHMSDALPPSDVSVEPKIAKLKVKFNAMDDTTSQSRLLPTADSSALPITDIFKHLKMALETTKDPPCLGSVGSRGHIKLQFDLDVAISMQPNETMDKFLVNTPHRAKRMQAGLSLVLIVLGLAIV